MKQKTKDATPSPSNAFRKMSDERLSVVDKMPKYNEANYCSFRDWAADCYIAGQSGKNELRKWLAIMVDNIKDGNQFNNDELSLWSEKAEAELSKNI
jgi:hypothetical protein